MLDGDGASPVELPVATAPPLDQSRVWTVGNRDGGKPRVRASNPHLHFIGLRNWGPPASSWAGRPRSGRESRLAQSLDWPGGDQY